MTPPLGNTAAGPAEAAECQLPEDAVEVGRVAGAWGVKGAFKVKPFSSDPQALFSSKRWYLAAPEAPAGRAAVAVGTVLDRAAQRPSKRSAPLRATVRTSPQWPRLLRIVRAREHVEHVIAEADDVVDRDAAEALTGARVLIPRASFPSTQDDEFYWVDLIGLAVQNREGMALGQVVGLLETGPTCVLRVKNDDPKAPETLIPFVSAYVDQVDLAGRHLRVDWQPGD